LPPDDYQPSRPLYAASWLLASLIGYFALRGRGERWRSAFVVLICIFAALLALSFLM